MHDFCCLFHTFFCFFADALTPQSSVKDVAEWAQRVAHITPTSAQVLIENELDGESALELAKLPQQQLKEELIQPPYSLPGGAVVKLAKALSSLVPAPTAGHCLISVLDLLFHSHIDLHSYHQ